MAVFGGFFLALSYKKIVVFALKRVAGILGTRRGLVGGEWASPLTPRVPTILLESCWWRHMSCSVLPLASW